MAVTDLPLVAMLKTRLHWHQTRQKLLTENVANADTPGFKPKELKAPGFARRAARRRLRRAGQRRPSVACARRRPPEAAALRASSSSSPLGYAVSLAG